MTERRDAWRCIARQCGDITAAAAAAAGNDGVTSAVRY